MSSQKGRYNITVPKTHMVSKNGLSQCLIAKVVADYSVWQDDNFSYHSKI